MSSCGSRHQWSTNTVRDSLRHQAQHYNHSDGLEHSPVKVGPVNAAPHLCCVISCWFTPLLNKWVVRRGTILLCALFLIFFTLRRHLRGAEHSRLRTGYFSGLALDQNLPQFPSMLPNQLRLTFVEVLSCAGKLSPQ